MIESENTITRLEDLLVKNVIQNEEYTSNDVNSNNSKTKHNKQVPKIVIPKGKPKSGRVWKEPKERFSSIIKTKGIRLSLKNKQKLKEDLKRVKELSRKIIAQKEAEKQALKNRRKENLKRAEENRKKSEVFQVINNTAKIKRMKKKQLRFLEKRDTIKTLI